MPIQHSGGFSMSPAGLFTPDAGVPSEGAAVFTTQWAYGRYDFAADGGAIGNISLIGASIPDKSLVIGGFIRVVTILASGGSATGALKIAGANDLVSAAAFDGAPWSTTGTKGVIPVFTAATAIYVATGADIVFSIAAATLTAGKFDVYLAYIPVAA